MKINRNMAAVTTNTQLLRTENKLQASIERLSSGFKINSAGDNPAGMAISNKMRAQIDALDQANANANDGVSVLQIADGALNEVASILQRMRELAVQAGNDTNTYDDKLSMQEEIDELKKEIDRISTDTEYNTKKLLDGSSDVRVYSDDVSRVNISENVAPDKYSIEVEDAATQASQEYELPAAFVDGTIEINGVKVEISASMTADDFYNAIGVAANQCGGSMEIDEDSGAFTLKTDVYGSKASMNITFSRGLYEAFGGTTDPADTETEYYTETSFGTNATVTLSEGFGSNATVSTEGNRVYVRDNNGFSMDFLLNNNVLMEEEDDGTLTPLDSKTVEIEVTEIGAMKIQIGANQYQEMAVRIPEVSVESLYVDEVDVTAYNGADWAIETIDFAIGKLSSARSKIGAFQNRLDYANASLAETSEDMTAAYSRILDTDMAAEMTEYAQQNVLNQATISVLSQANDLPQQILSLLS